jgi:histidine triad (HIT) family protein
MSPVSDPSCLFCRIVAGEISAAIVRESEHTLAFRDVAPQAPVHVLVVPRDHVANLGQFADVEPAVVAELLREAHQVALAEGIAGSGYRLLFNTGPDAGQTVEHVHAHVMGGASLATLG